MAEVASSMDELGEWIHKQLVGIQIHPNDEYRRGYIDALLALQSELARQILVKTIFGDMPD